MGAALAGAALVVLFTTWSLGTARYGGPDEPAHVVRAYAVAHGEVRGEVPAAALGLAPGYRIVSAPRSLASGDPACFRHDSTVTPDCAVPSVSAAPVRVATSAGINPPLYYAGVGLLARLGPESDPLTYRVVAAVLNAVVLLLAVRRLAPLGGAAVAVFVAALTPAAWSLFGVVNPNGLEVALAVLAWAGVARWWHGPARSTTAALWVGVPLAVAVAMRPIALAAAIAALAVLHLAPVVPARRHWPALWGPLGVAVAATVVWQAVVGVAVVDDPRTARSGGVAAALGTAVTGLPDTARELVDSLGWLEYSAPMVAVLAWASGATLLVVAMVRRRVGRTTTAASATTTRSGATPADAEGAPMPALPDPGSLARRRRLAAVVWLGVLVLTPVVFEVAVFGTIGPIWQGRYSLPTWMGAAALAVCWWADGWPPRRESSPLPYRWPGWPQRVRRSGWLVAATLAVAETATFWAVLRRATVGTDGSWWFRDAVTITAAAHPVALLVLHVALVATLVVAARVVTMHPAPATPAPASPAPATPAPATPAPAPSSVS